MAQFTVRDIILCLFVVYFSIDSIVALPAKVSQHRESKASPVFVNDEQSESAQAEQLHRSGMAFEAVTDPESASPKQGVFGDQLPRESTSNTPMAQFENVPVNYVGPNYMLQSAPHRNLQEDPSILTSNVNFPDTNRQANFLTNPLNSYYQGLFNQAQLNNNNPPAKKPAPEDSINDVFTNAFKKYNVKKYLMSKIFGNTHEADEDENGFFSNKHLKRHGTAGVAAKVLGELIGIKIRESIEGIGKSFSEYAKDFTARNFVNLGHVFSRVLKIQ